MSRIELEAREVLLRRRRSLSPEGAVGPGETARRGSGNAAAVAQSEVVRRELAEIDAALSRIEEGCYGTCLNCGGPMGLQRLRAIPEARYCVACSGQVVAAE